MLPLGSVSSTISDWGGRYADTLLGYITTCYSDGQLFEPPQRWIRPPSRCAQNVDATNVVDDLTQHGMALQPGQVSADTKVDSGTEGDV